MSAPVFWMAFWALAFGYAFSSFIQILVPRELIARYLGRPGLREAGRGLDPGPGVPTVALGERRPVRRHCRFPLLDFVVIPSLRINTTYYGWRFAAYHGMVFTVSAVGAGIIVHDLLKGMGGRPGGGSRRP